MRLIHLYLITHSSKRACVYQRVYTCKPVPLCVLVHVPPRVLAHECLHVGLYVQAYVHLSVFLPYENYTQLYTQWCMQSCMQQYTLR